MMRTGKTVEHNETDFEILSVWSLRAGFLRLVCFPPAVRPHVSQVDRKRCVSPDGPNASDRPCRGPTICPALTAASWDGPLPQIEIRAPSFAFCVARFYSWKLLKASILSVGGFDNVFRPPSLPPSPPTALSDLFYETLSTPALLERGQVWRWGCPD